MGDQFCLVPHFAARGADVAPGVCEFSYVFVMPRNGAAAFSRNN